MLILVVNAGSSTLKAQLIETDTETVLMKAQADRIGYNGSTMKVTFPPDTSKHDFDVSGLKIDDCLVTLLEHMCTDPASPIEKMTDINAIGHRIVSGGEFFSHSVLVDEDVLEKVKLCGSLAPLHNPHAAACISHLMKVVPDTPQVTVFDSAFHMTMPKKAYMYALPMAYYQEHHIRRYGAHGTSHSYVSKRAAELLGRDIEDTNVISCHLGSGGSLACVQGGKCIDTTMGVSPLDGIIMSTRCGSIDPTIVTRIMRAESLSCDEMDDLMNKHSGLLGITGRTGDMREVLEGAEAGNERDQLAVDMYVYRIQKFIGEYFAVLPRTDAVIMTAGIGENSAPIREKVLEGLGHMGMVLDRERNNSKDHGRDFIISTDDSPIKLFVIYADEEMCIARETLALIQ